jgi:hypothetical protein
VGSGDVVRAVVDHAPSAIVLIDGVFGQAPAVRHKEILWAMARGVRMYGAASIGALRAAELAPHGMVGHGLIFRWYRRTPLADDAEVTVPMGPQELGSRALGEALIDIRLTLRRAERQGVIDKQLRQQLERQARSNHFSIRTFKSLLAVAASQSESIETLEALKTWLAHGLVKQKRNDAVGLLTHLSRFRTFEPGLMVKSEFELTESFAYDMDYYNLLDKILPNGA